MSGAMNARERILNLLQGKEVDRIPCFSGMGNVTTAGLEELGYRFATIHRDAEKMAKAAATSYRLFGYECAVVPFDLCVEAEALGCVMNAYEDVDQLLYPTIKEKVIHATEEMDNIQISDNIAEINPVPVVCEAIRLLKLDIGQEVAIGTYLLGPFTLAGQIMDLNDLFKLTFKKPAQVNALLDKMADVIIRIAKAYQEAGADYICIREMGATTDVLGPKQFRAVIQPNLQKVFANINYPKILHICGSTNPVIDIMNECGADALSVEPKNDLLKSREVIGPEPLIFGAIDAYNILVNGTPDQVALGVIKDITNGVDALWPSCDIWPTAPVENLQEMVDTVKDKGAELWSRKK